MQVLNNYGNISVLCLTNLKFLSNMQILLRCQAQLELTLMMCLSDRSTSIGALSDHSTFTSTDAHAMDLHHCFFGGVVFVFEVLVTSSAGVLAAVGDVLTQQQQ
jgi:hypothetical protein